MLTDWCCSLLAGLKSTSTAPILISKLAWNLQMLFKTMIVFLQRCFIDDKLFELNISVCLLKLQVEVSAYLERKDLVNMDLGYAASMIYILLLRLDSENSIEYLVTQWFNLLLLLFIFKFYIYNCLFRLSYKELQTTVSLVIGLSYAIYACSKQHS